MDIVLISILKIVGTGVLVCVLIFMAVMLIQVMRED